MEKQSYIITRPGLIDLWPYLLFSGIVLIWNYLFLPDGFNATDEGWLLSVADRVVEGQQPYKDFYFLINPLTIYVQSALIYVFGDNYNILASRIYWATQMWLLAVLFSVVYKKCVNSIELFLLLVASWFVSTLLIQYPWYNYEAVFYTSLAIVALSRSKYYLFGLFIFLSFFAKQNYILFLPLFYGIGFVIDKLGCKLNSFSRIALRKAIIGFLVPAAIYIIYLAATGSLESYYQNIIVYPAEATARGWLFGIFQNNHIAILFSIPILIAVFLLMYSKNWKWLIAPILFIPVILYMYNHRAAFYIYNLAMVSHAILIFLVFKLKKTDSILNRDLSNYLIPLQLAGTVMIYLSGFSYVGITSSYMASGIVLTISCCTIKKISPSVYVRYIPAGLMIFLLIVGIYIKHDHVYRDAPRKELLSEFKSGMLSGIKTNPRNFTQINELIAAVNEYTQKGDYILIYPDFPVLYYLTDRKNPTPNDWFYWRGLHQDIIVRSAHQIRAKMPKVIFIQKYSESNYNRVGSGIDYTNTQEYALLYDFINDFYRWEKTIGDIYLYVPKV